MSGRAGAPDGRPKVSIGLPVYNGEQFLERAIESVLSQSFADLELVISDNASTDGTEEICRRWAARDPRVRYHRSATNLGAAPNFNRVVELSTGRYFKWAAHDDVIEPGFLAACVDVLDRDPSVVLCSTGVGVIDSEGRHLGEQKVPSEDAHGGSPVRRFAAFADLRHWCVDVFGLIRRGPLDTTALIGPYANSDRVLLAELMLHGRLHRVDDTLIYNRDHPDRSVKRMTLRERAQWFDSRRRPAIVFPYWRMLRELTRSIRRAPAPLAVKAGCLLALVGWARRYRRRLYGDMKMGVKHVGRRVQRRFIPGATGPE